MGGMGGMGLEELLSQMLLAGNGFTEGVFG